VEDVLSSLAKGEEKITLMESLKKRGCSAFCFGKLSGGSLSLKVDSDILKIFFPVRGQNWFYLTGSEIRDGFEKGIGNLLNSWGMTSIGLLRKLLDSEMEKLGDNPKAKDELLKLQFKIPAPYSPDKSLEVLQNLPSEPRGSPRFYELIEASNAILRIAHLFPPIGVDPEKFFKIILGNQYSWSRFDGTTPREIAKAMRKEAKLDFAVGEKLIELFPLIPTVRRELIDVFKSQHQVLSAEKDAQQKLWKTWLQKYQVTLREYDLPRSWFLEKQDQQLKFVEGSTQQKFAQEIITLGAQKPPNYGQALSDLSDDGKKFLKDLRKTPELSSLMVGVQSYLLSFNDHAFADLAVKRMRATLASADYQPETDEYGEFSQFIPKKGSPFGEPDPSLDEEDDELGQPIEVAKEND
jgi:hypothetical protein